MRTWFLLRAIGPEKHAKTAPEQRKQHRNRLETRVEVDTLENLALGSKHRVIFRISQKIECLNHSSRERRMGRDKGLLCWKTDSDKTQHTSTRSSFYMERDEWEGASPRESSKQALCPDLWWRLCPVEHFTIKGGPEKHYNSRLAHFSTHSHIFFCSLQKNQLKSFHHLQDLHVSSVYLSGCKAAGASPQSRRLQIQVCVCTGMLLSVCERKPEREVMEMRLCCRGRITQHSGYRSFPFPHVWHVFFVLFQLAPVQQCMTATMSLQRTTTLHN